MPQESMSERCNPLLKRRSLKMLKNGCYTMYHNVVCITSLHLANTHQTYKTALSRYRLMLNLSKNILRRLAQWLQTSTWSRSIHWGEGRASQGQPCLPSGCSLIVLTAAHLGASDSTQPATKLQPVVLRCALVFVNGAGLPAGGKLHSRTLSKV